MMSSEDVSKRDLRSCEWCDYTTRHRQSLSIHRKSCKLRPESANLIESFLRERVASLEAQVAAKDKHITKLEGMIGKQLEDTQKELKEVRKRKDRSQSQVQRKFRPEPVRRQIAKRQGWRCNNPDGGCLLPGEIQEYEVDHIIPPWKGGTDDPENLQALCPGCHSRKPTRENAERANWANSGGRSSSAMLSVA